MMKRLVSLFIVLLIVWGMLPTLSHAAAPASLDKWITSSNPRGLKAIEYGNGRYVAVDENNILMTSTDLQSWETIDSSGVTMTKVRYCNGKFVAVGINNYVMTSGDGVSWQGGKVTNNPNEHFFLLLDVTCGGGKFVAVGAPGVLTSNDGTPGSWTIVKELYLVGAFQAVTYGNGKFVAVGKSMDPTGVNPAKPISVTSTNGGVNWTVSNMNTSESQNALTYGNGTFVSAGHNGEIMVSKDGLSWASHGISGIPTIAALIYANGKFVAGGGPTQVIYSSTDGVSWDGHETKISHNISAIIYANDTYVAGSSSFFKGLMLAPPTYKVAYSGNGSTGGTAPVDGNPYARSEMVKVTNQKDLIKSGYSFVGWNTGADGKGTSYAANAELTMGPADITLFAQWTKNPTYTVTYNGNGSTGGTLPRDNNAYEQSAKVTVAGNTGGLVKAGSTFAGWNTAPDGKGTSYAGNASFNMGTANVTLYAQWSKNPAFTVTYNGNGSTGGTVPSDNNAYEQSARVAVVGNIGGLEKTGSTFAGWNTAADGSGTNYAANTAFNMGAANVTLYAHWTKNPTYIVKYDENGSTSGIIPLDPNFYEEGAVVTVKENEGRLLKNGSAFVGWNTARDGSGTSYAGNTAFNMGSANVTLYAQWKEDLPGKQPDNPKPADPKGEQPQDIELSDIAGHWAEAGIKLAVKAGIVSGYPDGTFQPGKTVTRAEFAVMLIQALKPQGERGRSHSQTPRRLGNGRKKP